MKKLIALLMSISLCIGIDAKAIDTPSKKDVPQVKVMVNKSQTMRELLEKFNAIRYEKSGKGKVVKLKKFLTQFGVRHDIKKLSAEGKIVRAAILADIAKEEGGLKALSWVKESKKLLLEVTASKTPDIWDGYAYTALSALYIHVPGWPLGFGSMKTAKLYLDKAMKVDPKNIDTNYYMADYYKELGNKDMAKKFLKVVLTSPIRPDHTIGDNGRKKQAELMLKSL